jgi:hypothetical protein
LAARPHPFIVALHHTPLFSEEARQPCNETRGGNRQPHTFPQRRRDAAACSPSTRGVHVPPVRGGEVSKDESPAELGRVAPGKVKAAAEAPAAAGRIRDDKALNNCSRVEVTDEPSRDESKFATRLLRSMWPTQIGGIAVHAEVWWTEANCASRVTRTRRSSLPTPKCDGER